MKQWCIWLLACLAGISVFAATDGSAAEFTATLPDGTTVELIGLRCFDKLDLEKFKDRDVPWWRPDGLSLRRPPNSWRGGGVGGDSHLFVIRVTGDASSDCRAVGPWATLLSVQPVKRRAQGFEQDDLRQFTLRFASNQKQADIKLGLATGDWKVADRWSIGPRWTPYNSNLSSSDQLILRCPEQKGSDVIAEVTQVITERATRLVLFDKDGNRHESQGEIGGQGVGLVRHIHRFKNLDRSNIDHIEFHAREYNNWVTFRDVSLQTGHKTQVEVDIKQTGALLRGNSLPGFGDIELDFATKDNKGRRLLICFFDMNQRPSRRCISEIAKKAKRLKEEGVAVVAIQASKINQDSLDEWSKQNSIPFSIGTIKGDVEKVRFIWGVQSLPWLILTDRQHLVSSAGFGLSELDDKIEAAN